MIDNENNDETLNYSSKHELFHLADKIDENTFLYILRSLYRIVFKSSKRKESKSKLLERIRSFENSSKLSNSITRIPIDELLVDLEEAQYFYPIRKQETEFPVFL